MKRTRTGQSGSRKQDLLSPYCRSTTPGEVITVPGFGGPRPVLSLILKVLSGRNRQMIADHLRFFLWVNFQFSTPEMQKAWDWMQEGPEAVDYAVESMVTSMRDMAEMWIESGKSRTDRDVDTPTDRNVEDVLPGRPGSLFGAINTYFFNQYPRYTGMRRDGTQAVRDATPRFDPEWLTHGLKSALERYGRMMAAFYFARLLDSKFSYHITRCDNCKVFFGYERARHRTVTHGVHCSKCDQKGSVKRTEASRSKRFETAAKAWIEWEFAPRNCERWEWVTRQVNKAHGQAFGARWITQNLIEIQKRVEALRNAKG